MDFDAAAKLDLGQFPQDEANGQNVAFVPNFWSSAGRNGSTDSTFLNCSEEILPSGFQKYFFF